MKVEKEIKSKFVDFFLSIDGRDVEMNLVNIDLQNVLVKFEFFDSSFENVYYFVLVELSNKFYFIKIDFNTFNIEKITKEKIFTILDGVNCFESNDKSFIKVMYKHYFSLFDSVLNNKIYVNTYFYKNNYNNEYEYYYAIIEKTAPFISIQDYYFSQN